MGYDAVIFDNDGVLTHPTATAVVRRAVERTFESFGLDPAPDRVEDAVDGSLGRVKRACDPHDVKPGEFWPARERAAAAAQRSAVAAGEKPLYEDVDALAEMERPLGVVSNNQQATVDAILDLHGLGDLFETAYGREPSLRGLRRKKPGAYYLNRALTDLGVDPADALYVGDSNVDVLAADAAGTDVAFVRRPHRADYDLAAAPTHVVETLHEVRALAES